MRNGSPKVVDGAAEAVAYIDAIRLPIDPVEVSVVGTALVNAKPPPLRLVQRIVGVVYADESCA